jgi:threonine synthase
MNQQTPDNEVARLCPHCGGKWDKSIQLFECETSSSADYRTDRCREREMMQKAEAEVERLRALLNRAIETWETLKILRDEIQKLKSK